MSPKEIKEIDGVQRSHDPSNQSTDLVKNIFSASKISRTNYPISLSYLVEAHEWLMLGHWTPTIAKMNYRNRRDSE